jgi:hypothetical protein
MLGGERETRKHLFVRGGDGLEESDRGCVMAMDDKRHERVDGVVVRYSIGVFVKEGEVH